MRIGMQVSIRDSVDLAADRAKEIGCEAIQIFSCNPRSWRAKPLEPESAELLREKLDTYDIRPLVVHVTYLPNPASPDGKKRGRSTRRIIEELRRAELLGADYFVLHCGSHMGAGVDAGVANVVDTTGRVLAEIAPGLTLLLENSAGSRNCVGGRLEHIARIIDDLGRPSNLGVCFDSAHAFVAGYDLRTKTAVRRTVKQFDKLIGTERLCIVHSNDPTFGLGSGRDRHEHVGKGAVGPRGLLALMRQPGFKDVPFILETPVKKKGDDAANVRALKRLRRRASKPEKRAKKKRAKQ